MSAILDIVDCEIPRRRGNLSVECDALPASRVMGHTDTDHLG